MTRIKRILGRGGRQRTNGVVIDRSINRLIDWETKEMERFLLQEEGAGEKQNASRLRMISLRGRSTR